MVIKHGPTQSISTCPEAYSWVTTASCRQAVKDPRNSGVIRIFGSDFLAANDNLASGIGRWHVHLFGATVCSANWDGWDKKKLLLSTTTRARQLRNDVHGGNHDVRFRWIEMEKFRFLPRIAEIRRVHFWSGRRRTLVCRWLIAF